MVQVIDFQRNATFAWSQDKLPLLVSGTVGTSLEGDNDGKSQLELWSVDQLDKKTPLAAVEVGHGFNDLDWAVDNSTIAGALKSGEIEVFKYESAGKKLESKGVLNAGKSHTGGASVVTFNSKISTSLLSGGKKNGEIYVWDLNKLGEIQSGSGLTPVIPGRPIVPVEEIASLAWNKSLSHVFASASNTANVSIFDLKAKKEVIHLAHSNSGTNLKSLFSVVEWHPTNSTKIATATNNSPDSSDVAANINAASTDSIFIWDLRNSSVPLNVLNRNGHTGGILSLDWCSKDESLLLSSGSDNTVLLWNPENGECLTKYPSKRNWCFKTKFAPSFPDIFASSSLDGRIDVQTLQDLTNTFDKQVNDTKINESETDFWNHVSSEDKIEKPSVMAMQAPSWYGNESVSAATWSFGGKIVSIGKDGKSVNITKPNLPGYFQENKLLDEALKSKDFAPIINQRLVKTFNDSNEKDWNLLEKLSMDGKAEFLKEAFAIDGEEDDEEAKKLKESEADGEDFFQKLESSYDPKGSFKFTDDSHQSISKDLINGEIKSAVVKALEKNYLSEALIIALDSDDQKLKDSVKHAYFAKHGDDSPLSRFLYSYSNKNLDDLIDNFDKTQWKYVVKTISNFYESDVKIRNELLIKLGEKLLEDGNRQDALTVFLAADSLDNVASIWLEEFTENENKFMEINGSQYEAHVECLTEFVERITIFTKFVGSETKITNEDLIAKLLEFVTINSDSGSFELAYKFLETLPGENDAVSNEKERLLVASGQSGVKQATKGNKYGAASSGLPNDFASKATAFAPRLQSSQSIQSAGVTPPVAATSTGTSSSQLSGLTSSVAPFQNSKYAPPAAVAPVVNPISSPYGSSQKIAQQQTFYQPAINPYATTVIPSQPVLANLNKTNTMKNDAASIPPPPTNLKSGQTPQLSKEANYGWNDLPIKAKDVPSRAKAVAVTPVAANTQQHSPITLSNVPPPPPLSRTASNVAPAIGSNVPMKTGKSMNLGAPKSASNPYAPPARSPSSATPTSSATNQYAPIAATLPPNNGGMTGVPPNSYAPQRSLASNSLMTSPTPPVQSPQKAPVGPPPINAKKKSHNEAVVANAGSLLSSIQNQPEDQIPIKTVSNHSIPTPPVGQIPAVTSNGGSIPEDQKPIIEFFKSEIERVTPLIPKEYTKQLKDCNKRLAILYQHLQNQDLLTQATVDKLHNIISLMKEGKYSDAMAVHVDIATNNAQEGGNWLTGVKRLISIAEATVAK